MKNLTIFVLLLVSSLAVAKDTKWKKELKKNGITVYSKKSKSSSIQSLRAIGDINASVYKITTILRDVKSATKWVPNLKKRKYIENISDTEAILYEVTVMPWPLVNRDTATHYELVLSEDKKSAILRFSAVSNKIKKEVKGLIRAKMEVGEIIFTPKGDKTRVEMTILVDPKGAIPSWAVNWVNVSMPYDFLYSLNKFAAKSSLKTPEGLKQLLDQIK